MYTESKGKYGADYEGTTSNDSNDLSKVLIGALAGAAVGSLIGGSFTQKGIEIRNRVGEGSKNIASNLKDKVSDATDALKDKVSGVTDAIADKYEAAKESASDLIEKGKQKVGLTPGNTNYKSKTAYTSTYEDDEETGAGSKILIGALIASVAGTLIWSLATEKGKETRKQIARSSKDLASNFKEKVTDVAGSLADGISETYEAAKEGAADLLQKELQKSKTSLEDTPYKSSTGADNW